MFVDYLSPDEHDEYTIDMYYSRHDELKCLVPRLRIETRAGEVSKGRTSRIRAMDELRERMGTIEGARGCITLQVFVERASGTVSAIEINPRFGGGFPLSYEAGANYPRWLIEEYLLGKTIESFDDWESDLTMLRYDAHVVVRGAAA
jgi:carbamoyl-phosphate synthase large subunit